MTPKQLAAIEKNAAAGAAARQLLDAAHKTCPECGHGTNIFVEREQQIIREAVNWFRDLAVSKDDHLALRYVAALAEVRAMHEALGYRVKKADEAVAALHQGD